MWLLSGHRQHRQTCNSASTGAVLPPPLCLNVWNLASAGMRSTASSQVINRAWTGARTATKGAETHAFVALSWKIRHIRHHPFFAAFLVSMTCRFWKVTPTSSLNEYWMSWMLSETRGALPTRAVRIWRRYYRDRLRHICTWEMGPASHLAHQVDSTTTNLTQRNWDD